MAITEIGSWYWGPVAAILESTLAKRKIQPLLIAMVFYDGYSANWFLFVAMATDPTPLLSRIQSTCKKWLTGRDMDIDQTPPKKRKINNVKPIHTLRSITVVHFDFDISSAATIEEYDVTSARWLVHPNGCAGNSKKLTNKFWIFWTVFFVIIIIYSLFSFSFSL